MYREFAEIYDRVMDNVPYDEWSSFLIRQIHKYKPDSEFILDLACGTGNISFYLKQVFSLSGMDISEKMLDIARIKNPECTFSKCDISQDFLSEKKFDVITCIYDSVNYLNSIRDLNSFLDNSVKNLKKNGLLIFDVITMEKIHNLFRNNIFVMEEKDLSCIWYNKFITKEIFVNDLVFFVRKQKNEYLKFTEKHKRRIFSEKTILDSARVNGFNLLNKFDGFSEKSPDKYSERILYIFRREEF